MMIKAWSIFISGEIFFYIWETKKWRDKEAMWFFWSEEAVSIQRMDSPFRFQNVWFQICIPSGPGSSRIPEATKGWRSRVGGSVGWLQRQSLINTLLGSLGPIQGKRSQNYHYSVCSLHCAHGAPRRVHSSCHGLLVVVYNICLHHSLWLFYFCFV